MATIVRLYDALTLLMPTQGEGRMPHAATMPMPACLLCNRRDRLPPAKTAWISAAGVETLGVVCSACNCDCPDQAELEARILAKVSAGPAMAAAPPPPHVPPTTARPAWAHRAAQAWTKPLTAVPKNLMISHRPVHAINAAAAGKPTV
jgi:hypothetical protein